jgi:NTP pyrophosphatase (non-canonical NTP hydrolase)
MQLDNELVQLINICEKSPYSLKELQSLVIDWAAERNMLNRDAAQNQYLKILEEYGEVAGAVLKLEKNGIEPLIDGIGDVMVTITIILAQLDKQQYLQVSKADIRTGNIYSLHSRFIENYSKHDYFACAEIIQSIAHLYNLNPTDCLWYAYQIISKRKGYTTEDGTFIKDKPKLELPQPEID